MTSNRSVSEMVERDETTALGRLAIFASETNDYTIRAEQMRPDVRELLSALSSQAQSDDVVERVRGEVLRIMDDHPFCRIPPSAVEEITRAALAAIPPAGLRSLVETGRDYVKDVADGFAWKLCAENVVQQAKDDLARFDATLNESSAIGGGDGR